MRALVQRVQRACVSVGGETVGAIGPGLVVFLGIGQGDTLEDARYLVDKVLTLRVFPDAEGRFHHSVQEVGGGILVISQFTLYADTRKGRRPSFTQAAPPAEAQPLYEQAVALFRQSGLAVATGRFQERMLVEVHNDGPVSILIDSADRLKPRG
ncbi:MAG: D-aminoacyl-tRNA deacylase [Dehalococcoidia bacterium]|nr:D-aminoacyl-tRNA deacylase [Dehalococcoidia bacterium]MDW8119969.1 D-aminoacyl-tRNA deacylase [Chloroflexota bacterium]